MGKILLCDRPADVGEQIPTVGRALLVWHKHQPPVGPWSAVTFDAFRSDPQAHLAGVETLIFVGLNSAKTPGNRTDPVWEWLGSRTRHLNKISVDTSLFVSEPWRMVFHWHMVGEQYGDFTYSYVAESRWNGWREGVWPADPFGQDEVSRWGRGVVQAMSLTPVTLDERVLTLSGEVHDRYQLEKAAAFEEEKSAKAIIRRLSTFAASVAPSGRKIPQAATVLRGRAVRVVRTDLGVDAYLAGEVRSQVELHNWSITAFIG